MPRICHWCGWQYYGRGRCASGRYCRRSHQRPRWPGHPTVAQSREWEGRQMIRRVLCARFLSVMRITRAKIMFLRFLIDCFKWVRVRAYQDRWFVRTRTHTWDEHETLERQYIREADARWKEANPDVGAGPGHPRLCCEACSPFPCHFCGKDLGVLFGDEKAPASFTIIPLGAELLEYIGAHHLGVFRDWDCDHCSPRWYDWWCYACHKHVPSRWTFENHYSVCGQNCGCCRARTPEDGPRSCEECFSVACLQMVNKRWRDEVLCARAAGASL